MKKKISLILGCLTIGFALPLSAMKVTPEDAAKEAATFLNAVPSASNIQRAPANADSLSLAYSGQEAGESLFYIFNSDTGFVIVAADTRFNSILGYSDAGKFDESRMPENMKNWLSGYASEISHYLPILPENTSQLRTQRASEKRTPIAPLLSTKWDQGTPYNLLCPVDAHGGQSVTGCVATAYAQIMKYHQWPRNPVGSSDGVTFDGTFYNWRSMIDEYLPGKYNSTQATAVATLMRQCGAAVNMRYSSWASGAYSHNVPPALTQYFKYSPDLKILWKDYIPQKEWTSIIYSELQAGRPVYYSGASPQGGHAFVCDGYSENDYFHFNWGWGGYEDGYFLLSALNPATGGAGSYEGGYTSQQSIIIDIKPGTDSCMPSQIQLISSGGFYHTSGNSYEIKDSNDEYNLIYNPLGYAIDVDVALKITSEEDESFIKYLSCGGSVTLESLNGFMNFSSSALPALSDGSYKIIPVFKSADSAGGWQPVSIPLGKQSYVALEVKDGNPVFTNPGPDKESLYQLIFGTPETTRNIYGNLPIAMKLPVVNVGKGDFFGYLSVTLTNIEDEFANGASSFDYYSIPAETSRYVNVTFQDKLTTGRYVLSIMDMNGVEYGNNLEFEVKSANVNSPESALTVSDIFPSFITSGHPSSIVVTIENPDLLSTQATLEFKVLDNTSFSPIKKLPVTASYNVAGNSSNRYGISPFDFDLKPGEYFLQAIDKDGNPLSMPSPLIVNSEVTDYNGISYIVTSEAEHKAIVVAPEGDPYSGSVYVPGSLNGYTVTSLRNDAFTFSDSRSVMLPENINRLDPGTFYSAINLNQLNLNSKSIIPFVENIFRPDQEKNIWLQLPESLINEWMVLPGWNRFRSPAWYVSTDGGVEITDGMEIDSSTSLPYSPYRVNFNTPLQLSLKAPEGKNVRIIMILNGDWIMNEVIDPRTTLIEVPAPGYFSTGEIRLSATSEDVHVEGINSESQSYFVYSIDGRIVAKNASTDIIKNLKPGVYIVNGKKVLIK